MSDQTRLMARLERLRRVAQSFGGDPVRWPAADRDELAALFASDESADIRAEAQALDNLLNEASAPQMEASLEQRVAAGFAAPPAPRSIAAWFDEIAGRFGLHGARLVPAGAIAGLGAVGLASGVFSASMQASVTPESEALAYAEASVMLASLDEEEGASWDAD